MLSDRSNDSRLLHRLPLLKVHLLGSGRGMLTEVAQGLQLGMCLGQR